MAAVYAVTKDPELDKIMDEFISLVAASQREDGYIHTQVNIAELNAKKKRKEAKDNTVVGTAQGTGADGALGNKLNFETYNISTSSMPPLSISVLQVRQISMTWHSRLRNFLSILPRQILMSLPNALFAQATIWRLQNCIVRQVTRNILTLHRHS